MKSTGREPGDSWFEVRPSKYIPAPVACGLNICGLVVEGLGFMILLAIGLSPIWLVLWVIRSMTQKV